MGSAARTPRPTPSPAPPPRRSPRAPCARFLLSRGTESLLTLRWREPDSNPRSHPTTLVAAHIPPIIDATPRRSSAAALADGFVPLESDRRHCRIRLHRSRTLVFAQRDPHPQVGPGARIHFPPARSLRTIGPTCRLSARVSRWMGSPCWRSALAASIRTSAMV
jgi:hypothetical protein